MKRISPSRTSSGYAKISATLEEPVLREIREQTDNVSGFLNEAAKRKLYFDRLRATETELVAAGVKRDERFYAALKKRVHEADRRKALRRRRAPTGAASG